MTWGVFNKIAKGAKDTFNFVKSVLSAFVDKAIPAGKEIVKIGKKVVDVAKPFLEGTKWGKKNIWGPSPPIAFFY